MSKACQRSFNPFLLGQSRLYISTSLLVSLLLKAEMDNVNNNIIDCDLVRPVSIAYGRIADSEDDSTEETGPTTPNHPRELINLDDVREQSFIRKLERIVQTQTPDHNLEDARILEQAAPEYNVENDNDVRRREEAGEASRMQSWNSPRERANRERVPRNRRMIAGEPPSVEHNGRPRPRYEHESVRIQRGSAADAFRRLYSPRILEDDEADLEETRRRIDTFLHRRHIRSRERRQQQRVPAWRDFGHRRPVRGIAPEQTLHDLFQSNLHITDDDYDELLSISIYIMDQSEALLPSAQTRMRIEMLRRENAQSSRIRFLRTCRECGCADPTQRVFSTACGHAVCSECTDKHSKDSSLFCPTCNTRGGFVPLFENASSEGNGNGVRFSRDCGVCLDTPHHRAVFKSCGHLICLACAEKLSLYASEKMREVVCPFCKGEGGWRRMVEETEDIVDHVWNTIAAT